MTTHRTMGDRRSIMPADGLRRRGVFAWTVVALMSAGAAGCRHADQDDASPLPVPASGGVGTTAAATASNTATAPRESLPNVLLIVMDTVRADHMGIYGHDVNNTPQLARLCETSTRYARAYSTASWTLPSHASLFTGLFPFEHGAHSFMPQSKRDYNAYALPRAHVTLAEFLGDYGYETHAVAMNRIFLRRAFQLDQGFEIYREARGTGPDAYAHVANEMALYFLRRRSDARPFFLFINYMDAHRPINPAERPGLFEQPTHADPDGEFTDDDDPVAELHRAGVAGRATPPLMLRWAHERYDSAIAHIDEAIGEVLRTLEQLGELDETIVVVTSDHGHAFGEHGVYGHGMMLYQPLIDIPLIVHVPGQTNARVERRPASLVDVPRLILDGIAGIPADASARVFPNRMGGHPVIAENYYARPPDVFSERWGHRYRTVRTAWIEGRWKYIHAGDGAHELYDMAADPAEQRDLIQSNPDVARRLAAALEAYQRERPAWSGATVVPPPPSADRQNDLEDTGYLDEDDDAGEEKAGKPRARRKGRRKPAASRPAPPDQPDGRPVWR